jgi:hypothetical protein
MAQVGLPAPPDLAGITVLVVDGRPASLAATLRLLQDQGYSVSRTPPAPPAPQTRLRRAL